MAEEKIQTMSPIEGSGGTRISKQKYDAYKKAILKVVPRSKEGITFKELPAAVKRVLPKTIEGSVNWYTVCVKLDLEARGLLERVPGAKPQRLRRTNWRFPYRLWRSCRSGLGDWANSC